jgi:hypothetical protein
MSKFDIFRGITTVKAIKTFAIASLIILGFISPGATHASVISDSLWHVTEALTYSAIPSNVPATTPDVTFNVNSPINFSGTSVTVDTWLNSGGAFNIVEHTANTLASLMDNGVQGAILEFNGFVTVTDGQLFAVTHDDGLTLIIGGIDLGFTEGPTTPITSIATYSGPAGNFPFQLVYAECCEGPAVLQADIPFSKAIPVPGTVLLIGTALAGMSLVRRCKMK